MLSRWSTVIKNGGVTFLDIREENEVLPQKIVILKMCTGKGKPCYALCFTNDFLLLMVAVVYEPGSYSSKDSVKQEDKIGCLYLCHPCGHDYERDSWGSAFFSTRQISEWNSGDF